MEECAEVIQSASKCNRFGPEDIHQSKGISNEFDLKVEINDITAIIEMLVDLGFNIKKEEFLIKAKKDRMNIWMEYSMDKGLLER
jgi:hypothetical protein